MCDVEEIQYNTWAVVIVMGELWGLSSWHHFTLSDVKGESSGLIVIELN